MKLPRLFNQNHHFGFSLLFVALASRSYAEGDWPSLILCAAFAAWDLWVYIARSREEEDKKRLGK